MTDIQLNPEKKPNIKRSLEKLSQDWKELLKNLEKRGIKKLEVYLVLACAITFLFSLKYGLIFLVCFLSYYIFALSKERLKNGNQPTNNR